LPQTAVEQSGTERSTDVRTALTPVLTMRSEEASTALGVLGIDIVTLDSAPRSMHLDQAEAVA